MRTPLILLDWVLTTTFYPRVETFIWILHRQWLGSNPGHLYSKQALHPLLHGFSARASLVIFKLSTILKKINFQLNHRWRRKQRKLFFRKFFSFFFFFFEKLLFAVFRRFLVDKNKFFLGKSVWGRKFIWWKMIIWPVWVNLSLSVLCVYQKLLQQPLFTITPVSSALIVLCAEEVIVRDDQ